MNWKKVEDKLLGYIHEHGYEYLKVNAEEIYQELHKDLKRQKSGSAMATAVYFSLLMNIPEYALELLEQEDLEQEIQNRCLMRADMAKELAGMYFRLFTKETVDALRNQEEKGFEALCDQEWECSWEGEEKWRPRGGMVYVSCEYTAEYTFKVSDRDKAHAILSRMLEKNPFEEEEELAYELQEEINAALTAAFEEYCDDDDYYPPVAEDFDAEDIILKYCEQMGLTCIEMDCSGMTGDYERDW